MMMDMFVIAFWPTVVAAVWLLSKTMLRSERRDLVTMLEERLEKSERELAEHNALAALGF